jgi:hypothetical protein
MTFLTFFKANEPALRSSAVNERTSRSRWASAWRRAFSLEVVRNRWSVIAAQLQTSKRIANEGK